MCNRKTGVGADGLVILGPPREANVSFTWDFFNADGSRAEMCGNGARCAAFIAWKCGVCCGPDMVIGTDVG